MSYATGRYIGRAVERCVGSLDEQWDTIALPACTAKFSPFFNIKIKEKAQTWI